MDPGSIIPIAKQNVVYLDEDDGNTNLNELTAQFFFIMLKFVGRFNNFPPRQESRVQEACLS